MVQSFPPATQAVPAVRPQATIARDWTKTLWPASYKGVPFFVETDGEEGSRRIVEHEFPMRDDAYLEDLGEGCRHFELDAYVASDRADADVASVIAICATRGPGMLVLPSQGPRLVRCLTFKRERKKDRAGYEALSLRFVREGFGSALASIAQLANLVFVQAEATALSAALSFAQTTLTLDMPDYAVEAAVSGVESNAAALETVRTAAPVDPEISAAQRVEIQSIFDAAESVSDSPAAAQDLALRVTASARALGKAMPPDDAVPQFEQVFLASQVVVPAPVYVTQGTLAAQTNEAAANQALRLAALIAYAEAIARITLADRPAAITLRANVAEYFESELLVINAGDIDLSHALMTLRDSVITYLSRAVLDLAPVIQVEANLGLPSLFWAWRLYQDPARSRELAARNRIAHPSFMPTEFEALAR
ncbi:hypothetical protein XI06_17060 [Bradyrhizobium sp. CCBAU 11434]|uniref:DNA circularization N-terminal domain-containing protein n=1 Tax=Bradyrhizobium sp. CCBAU 11434 TaxID=1630885 RepID=UPI0023069538|nr:DNA circularization N-terminal domain-containing protein [Bradyrhizobium sp. CCBAU 11434]MDA9521968.1 hypothetical protein [Bradyrhizobium sp. CCBAU 11434]